MTQHQYLPPIRKAKAFKFVSVSTGVLDATPLETAASTDPVPQGLVTDGLDPAFRGLMTRATADAGMTYRLTFTDRRHLRQGSVLTFYWGAAASAPYTITAADVTLGYLDRTIPAADIPDLATTVLRYTGATDSGNLFANTNDWHIRSDRIAPNGLGKVAYAQSIIDNGITPAALNADGDLAGLMPSYLNRERGDRVQPILQHGITSVEYTMATSVFTIQTDGSESVPFIIKGDDLRALANAPYNIYYRVTDRAGNISDVSAAQAIILLLAGVPETFEPPLVPAFDDGLINEADARAPVIVQIPPYTDVEVGDQIAVLWGSETLARVTVLQEDLGEDPLLNIPVPYSAIQAAGNGNVDVTYDVYRSSVYLGRPETPTPVVVDITIPGGPDPEPGDPWNGALSSLTVRSDSGQENLIDPADLLQPATITVPYLTADLSPDRPPEEYIEVGDIVSVYWENTLVEARDITAPVTADLTFTVTSAQMIGEGAGQRRVYYTVSREIVDHPDEFNETLSPNQTVLVQSRGELPGGENGLAEGDFTEKYINSENGDEWLNNGSLAAGRGTPFRIGSYENMALGDEVEFNYRGFATDDGTGPETPNTYFTTSHTVGDLDQARGYIELWVPEANLRATDYGSARGQYSIENAIGIPVDAADKVIRVDITI